MKTLPSPEQIEALVIFTGANVNTTECEVLCGDLQVSADDLQQAEVTLSQLIKNHASAHDIRAEELVVSRLKARLKALSQRMRFLHCSPCTLQ